mmetsp:Transcript_21522/g.43368  ORF Transcript_21522/g.43368 Transcript_21522/m.43368 type:complete len:219 (-) Transcript_21522:188-844(-)
MFGQRPDREPGLRLAWPRGQGVGERRRRGAPAQGGGRRCGRRYRGAHGAVQDVVGLAPTVVRLGRRRVADLSQQGGQPPAPASPETDDARRQPRRGDPLQQARAVDLLRWGGLVQAASHYAPYRPGPEVGGARLGEALDREDRHGDLSRRLPPAFAGESDRRLFILDAVLASAIPAFAREQWMDIVTARGMGGKRPRAPATVVFPNVNTCALARAYNF